MSILPKVSDEDLEELIKGGHSLDEIKAKWRVDSYQEHTMIPSWISGLSENEIAAQRKTVTEEEIIAKILEDSKPKTLVSKYDPSIPKDKVWRNDTSFIGFTLDRKNEILEKERLEEERIQKQIARDKRLEEASKQEKLRIRNETAPSLAFMKVKVILNKDNHNTFLSKKFRKFDRNRSVGILLSYKSPEDVLNEFPRPRDRRTFWKTHLRGLHYLLLTKEVIPCYDPVDFVKIFSKQGKKKRW